MGNLSLFVSPLVVFVAVVLIGVASIVLKHRQHAAVVWTLSLGAAFGCALVMLVTCVVVMFGGG